MLRVRLYPVGHPAEDASWAVLPGSRTAHAPVVADPDGFSTSVLRVKVTPDLQVTVMDLAGNVLQRDAVPISLDGSSFKVSKLKSPEDHFFGLGDKPGPLDRAGESFRHVEYRQFWLAGIHGSYLQIDSLFSWTSMPVEPLASCSTIRFEPTSTLDTSVPTATPSQPPLAPWITTYCTGRSPGKLLRRYAWLTGPTPLPPMWALGYQQSRYSYTPGARVEEVASRLRTDRIPSDVIWLDIDFQYKNRPFTVDPETFPDFPKLIHKLAAEHFHTVVITDLHVADAPNEGYAPYDSGKAGDHFVKENGKEYVGPVWPGPSVFPDFTRKVTRDWWGTLYKQFDADGVAGFWNDMNEPAVFTYPTKTMPDDVEHRIEEPGFRTRTALHPEIHNIYGMENTRATFDGQLALRPNVRPFVMTRASYAGGQRYAATWTGDNSSTWNHLRQTTPQLLNLGLSGFSLSGADVGGFAGSPSPALLTRWLMLAAFQPIDRDHAAKGTRDHEPWVDGPEQEAIRRRYIEERYRLMPYLYTTAQETSRDGMPIMRPLFLDFPHATPDNHPLDLDAPGEFLFGPSILVAASPSPEEVAPYEVKLPPGIWFNYWTGEKLDRRAPVTSRDLEIRDAKTIGLTPILVDPGPADLPVYVPAGTILPLAPLVQATGEKPSGPLTLRVFPGDDCQGTIYQDDGTTFDFREGAYLRQHFSCSQASDGAVTVSLAASEGHYIPWWTSIRVEIVGLNSVGTTATVASEKIAVERTPLGRAATFTYSGKIQSVIVRP